MFYPVESLKRGGRFYLCWVADSWPLRFNNVAHRQLWSQDVRKICADLLEVMTNESGSPSNRFSLRLSSQLTRGLVRLYQKKVNVLLGEVCMINANVLRHSNKKFNLQEKSPVHHRVPRMKVVVPQETENITLQVLEELLQNSGNLVGNIQEITLKEATIPELQLPNEGFGEENILQHLQKLTDMSVELMLQDPNQPQQTSGFDGLAQDVAEKSHEKSRLVVEQHMERMSEHDLTLFRKSTGAELLPPNEIEKYIPDIPDIPEIQQIPPPVLETEKQTAELPVEIPPEVSIPKAVEELQLEELEEGEPKAKRRRRRRGVIIDRTTKLSSNYLRARIDNINVELRCQDPSDDIVDIQVPAEVYFRRPYHSGSKFQSKIAIPLWELFHRNLDVGPRTQISEQETEEILHQSPRRLSKSILGNIPEEDEQVNAPTNPEIPQVSEIEQQIPRISEPYINISKSNINVSDPQMQVVQEDISDLLTQRVETLSQAKRVSEYDRSPKRRNVGVVSFSSFRQSNQFVVVAEVHIEPEKDIPIGIQEIEPTVDIPKDTEEGVSAMLQQVGLADLPPQKTVEISDQINISQKQIAMNDTEKQTRGSESSETQLGSLDRTKVSLGDSENTTDSKRFIRDQWGTEGTMIKILHCIKKGDHPLTPKKLVSKGPVISEYKRIILARCFTSILKLKQHGFIKVTKDPITQEILDIILGSKFN